MSDEEIEKDLAKVEKYLSSLNEGDKHTQFWEALIIARKALLNLQVNNDL